MGQEQGLWKHREDYFSCSLDRAPAGLRETETKEGAERWKFWSLGILAVANVVSGVVLPGEYPPPYPYSPIGSYR